MAIIKVVKTPVYTYDNNGAMLKADISAMDECVTYAIEKDDRLVGNMAVTTDGNFRRIKSLFVNDNEEKAAFGAICEIERMNPDVLLWEIILPYDEKENAMFFVNRCGYHIVEIFTDNENDTDYFRMEKSMRENSARE